MKSNETDPPPLAPAADPDLPVRLGILLLCEGEARMPEALAGALRVAHAYGPLREVGRCREHTLALVAELTDAGWLAPGEGGALAPTEVGSAATAVIWKEVEGATSALAGRIRVGLAEGVDLAQARMFADRAAALLRLLGAIAGDRRATAEARVLLAAFSLRAIQRLAGPVEKRARDVRDQIDFFYSRAAILRYREVNRDRPRRILKGDVRWRTVRPGVAAASVRMHLRRGPILANLLRVEPRRVDLRAVDVTGLPDDQRSLARIVRRFGAGEGTSGGFFLYSEDDLTPPLQRGDPVGLLVIDGEVRTPALFNRGALLVDANGHAHIRRVPLKGTTVAWDGGQVLLKTTNRPRAGAAEIVGYSRVFGTITPPRSGRTVTIVHRRVVAVGSGPTPIPLLGLVLDLPDDPIADPLVASLPMGTTVRYTLPATPREAPIVQAIAGGPMVLRDGKVGVDLAAEHFLPGVPPVTFSGDASIGMNLLPRLAWGKLPDHRLVALAVDGRNLQRSIGESLEGMGRLLRSLGCDVALNYDGGSSKRMCVEGEEVDLSTTALIDGSGRSPAPTRPLHTAWVVAPKRA